MPRASRAEYEIVADDRTKAAVASANKGLASIKKLAVSLGGALALAGGVRMFTGAIGDAIDLGDRLEKLNQSTGVSVETLSALDHAAELSGTSFETLAKSIGKMQKGMHDAEQGLKAQADTFKALGVPVTDADGKLRDTEQTLLDLADRFNQMEDGTKKSALAMQVFGRAGAEIIPFLNQGRDGIAAMLKEGREFGGWTLETAKQAAAVNDNLTRMSRAGHGVAVSIAQELLPQFEEFTGSLVEFAQDKEGIKETAEFIANGIKTIASGGILAKNALEALGAGLGGLAAIAVAAFEGEFSRIPLIWEEVSADMQKEVGEGLDGVNKLWDKSTKKIADDTKKNLSGALNVDSNTDGLKVFDDAIAKTISGLKRQAEVAGLSAQEIVIHDLKIQGATADQIEYARSLQASAIAQAELSAKSAAFIQKIADGYDPPKYDEWIDGQRGLAQSYIDAINPLAEFQKQAKEIASLQNIFHDMAPQLQQALQGVQLAMDEAQAEQLRKLTDFHTLEESEIKATYERRREQIVNDAVATEEEKQRRLRELEDAYNAERKDRKDKEDKDIRDAWDKLFAGMADISRHFVGEQSKTYRALFALSKAGAINESLVQITAAGAKALNAPYPANLLAAADVAAEGAKLMGTIKSIQYAGAYDAGGYIPPDSFGLVGERGQPELVMSPSFVKGPAQVIGRKDTAAMLNQRQAPQPAPVVNVQPKVINVLDLSIVGDYFDTADGEKTILNVIRRNPEVLR